MLATKNGHTEIVKYLVEKGADVKRAKEVSILSTFGNMHKINQS